MIEILQGSPGSGKSSLAVTRAALHLLNGGWVATNFSLTPDWLDLLCSYSFRYRFGLLDRESYRESLAARCWRIGSPDSVIQLGKIMRSSIKGRIREGTGLLILDEAQFLFNSRDSMKGLNRHYIEFFTQHRKLGWDVLMIAHTRDMIDKQIRGLAELETRLRNIQKIKVGPIRFHWFVRVPTFLVITRYAGISAGAGEIYSRTLVPINKRFASMYDTFEVFAFDAPHCDCTRHSEPPSKKKDLKTVQKLISKETPYYEYVSPRQEAYS